MTLMTTIAIEPVWRPIDKNIKPIEWLAGKFAPRPGAQGAGRPTIRVNLEAKN